MQTTFTDEVSAIQQTLAEKIGQQKYQVWFKNSVKFNFDGDCLTIDVPNNFIGRWIENHFLEDISFALHQVTGDKKRVTFKINPSLTDAGKRSLPQSRTGLQRKKQSRTVKNRFKNIIDKKTSQPLKLSLDTFIVGPKNQLAYNAAKAVVGEEKSPFNPLFFHGGYGVGKTHLLQGICNAVCLARTQAKWLYVSAEDFANQYVLALKTRKLDAFRARFRQMDVLAIDDIHFLASKNAMQEEFLHTFNTIDLAGKQIVLASDAHPKMIGQLCERLVNRFVSGMVVKIEPPDFDTRCKICRQNVELMNKDMPKNVIEYVASKMSSNVRELQGALLKLVAFSSLSDKKITLSMAQQVLADHISRTDPLVHASDITSAVTAFFGVSTTDVYSAKKDRTISLARAFCMYLARKYTRMSYPEIGRLMGNKNHATVILANRKIEDLVKRNAEARWIGTTGQRIAKAKDILDKLTETIS